MKKLITFASIAFATMYFGQTFTQTYKDRADLVLQSNINTYLTEFESFGVKTSGSTANNNALNWLKTKYTNFGYTASQITEHSYNNGGKTHKNLIVNKTGTTYPTKYIIICGHYDTINGPGVNDNGSGTSIILELARILKNVDSQYSIKFINFTGEEQGLIGSNAYVNQVVNPTNPKMDIKLVINLDEVGGVAGEVNDKISCEKDGTPTYPSGMYSNYPSSNNAQSDAANTIMMNSMSLYSNITPVSAYIERSDYMPFDKNGEVVIGLYEFNESSKPHTSGDTYVNMDPVYVYNLTKGLAGAVQHFGEFSTDQVLGINQPKNANEKISLFPNPVKDFLYVGADAKNFEITVTDATGKKVLTKNNSQMLDVSQFSAGVYLLTAKFDGQIVTKKFIVNK